MRHAEDRRLGGRPSRPTGQLAPIGRAATADDVADGILFLAESPYMTGEIMVIDGGFGLAR